MAVAGANAAGDDSVARYRILSILYAKRRQDMHRPGIGIDTLETLAKLPVCLRSMGPRPVCTRSMGPRPV